MTACLRGKCSLKYKAAKWSFLEVNVESSSLCKAKGVLARLLVTMTAQVTLLKQQIEGRARIETCNDLPSVVDDPQVFGTDRDNLCQISFPAHTPPFVTASEAVHDANCW